MANWTCYHVVSCSSEKASWDYFVQCLLSKIGLRLAEQTNTQFKNGIWKYPFRNEPCGSIVVTRLDLSSVFHSCGWVSEHHFQFQQEWHFFKISQSQQLQCHGTHASIQKKSSLVPIILILIHMAGFWRDTSKFRLLNCASVFSGIPITVNPIFELIKKKIQIFESNVAQINPRLLSHLNKKQNGNKSSPIWTEISVRTPIKSKS